MRYSGTEPLLRVMLEGKDQDDIRAWAQEIIDATDTHWGPFNNLQMDELTICEQRSASSVSWCVPSCLRAFVHFVQFYCNASPIARSPEACHRT